MGSTIAPAPDLATLPADLQTAIGKAMVSRQAVVDAEKALTDAQTTHDQVVASTGAALAKLQADTNVQVKTVSDALQAAQDALTSAENDLQSTRAAAEAVFDTYFHA